MGKGLAVEIGKIKDIRGRRIVAYYARLADLSARAETPDKALEQLAEMVTKACTFSIPRIVTFKGFAGIAFASLYSWRTILIFPDGHHTESSGYGDAKDAEESVREHIAQLVYPDADAVQVVKGTARESSFLSWTQWQDEHRAGMHRDTHPVTTRG